MGKNYWNWKIFFASLIIRTVIGWPTLQPQLRPVTTKYELESDESRKVLGSSVVTSVSVIMDHGNGTKTFLTEKIDNPELKTNAISSPGNLLSPDKYEFYTFDETGDLVKRLMTWDEIQGLIAGSDGDGILGEGSVPMYYSESVADKLGAATHLTANDFQTSDIQGVHKVVERVQNVLKSELAASQSKIPPVAKPGLLSSAPNWSLFLPNLLDNMDDGVDLSNMLASQTAHLYTSPNPYSNVITSTSPSTTSAVILSGTSDTSANTFTSYNQFTDDSTIVNKEHQKKTEKPIRFKHTTTKPTMSWTKNSLNTTIGKIRIRPTTLTTPTLYSASTPKSILSSVDSMVSIPNTNSIAFTSEQHSTLSPHEIYTTNNELHASIANVLNQVNENDKTSISTILSTSDSKLNDLDFLSSSSYTNGIGTASVTDSISLDENITATATTAATKNLTKTSSYTTSSQYTHNAISEESDKEKNKNTTYLQHWASKKPATNDQQLRNNASNIETQTRINTATKYNYNNNKDSISSTLSSVYQYQQDRIKSSKPPPSSSSLSFSSSFESTTPVWYSTSPKKQTTFSPSSYQTYAVKTTKPSKPIPNFTKISSVKPSNTFSPPTYQYYYSTKPTPLAETSSKTSYIATKFTTDRPNLFEGTTTRPEPLVTWISTYPLEQNQKITVNGEILDSDKLVTEQYVSGGREKLSQVRNNSIGINYSSTLFNEKIFNQTTLTTESLAGAFNTHSKNESAAVATTKPTFYDHWTNNHTTFSATYGSRPSTKPIYFTSTTKLTSHDTNFKINSQRFTTTTESDILESKTEPMRPLLNSIADKYTIFSIHSTKSGTGSSGVELGGTPVTNSGTKYTKITDRPSTTSAAYSTSAGNDLATSAEIVMQRVPTINPPNKMTTSSATYMANLDLKNSVTNKPTSFSTLPSSQTLPLSSSYYTSTEVAKNLTQIAIMMNKSNDTIFDKKNTNKNSEFKNKLTTKPYMSAVTLNYITNLVDKYTSQTTKPLNGAFLNDCITSFISNSMNNSYGNNSAITSEDHISTIQYDNSHTLPEEKHRIDAENSQVHFQKWPSTDQKENSHIYYYKLPPINAPHDTNSISTPTNNNRTTDTTNFIAVSMSSPSSAINSHKTSITPALHYFKASTSTEKLTTVDKEYQKVTTVDRPPQKITGFTTYQHDATKMPDDDIISNGISAVTNFLMQTEGRIPNRESIENTPSNYLDFSSGYTLQNREAVSENMANAKTESDGILFSSAELLDTNTISRDNVTFKLDSNETSTTSLDVLGNASSLPENNLFTTHENIFGVSNKVHEYNNSISSNRNYTTDNTRTTSTVDSTVPFLYSTTTSEKPITPNNLENDTKTSPLLLPTTKITTTSTTSTTLSTPTIYPTTTSSSDFRNEYVADDHISENEQDDDNEEDEEEEEEEEEEDKYNHQEQPQQYYQKPTQTQNRLQNSNNYSHSNDRYGGVIRNNTFTTYSSLGQNIANKSSSNNNLNSNSGAIKLNTNEKLKNNTANWNKIASLESKTTNKNNSLPGITLAIIGRPSTLQTNDSNINNGMEYVQVKLENKTINTITVDRNKPKENKTKIHESNKFNNSNPTSAVPTTLKLTPTTTTLTTPLPISGGNNNSNVTSAFRSPSSVSDVRSPVSTTISSSSIASSSTTPNPAIELHPAPNEHMGLEASVAYLGDDVRRFVDLCNELSFKIWTTQTGKSLITSRSIVLSPFAVLSTLAMIFLGARGSSSGILNDFLRLDDMVTFNPHQVFQNITESAINPKNIGVANSAFVREIFSDKVKGKVLEFYKERLQQYYDTYIEEINYNIIGDLVRRRTNLLVKRQTQGRIQDYLKGSALNLKPPLAALTANIFQTNCDIASTEGRDGEMYFVVRPSTRQRRLVPIPAVVYRSGFLAGYEPGLDATAVTLSPESIISTILVLPGQQGQVAPGDGLARLEQRLLESSYRRGAWSRLLRSLLFRHGLELQIPRFSHRSVLNLTAGLQKMGMSEIFTPDKADLRGINGLFNELHLSDIVQVNTFSTCGEETVGARHHIETYPSSPQRVGRTSDAFDYSYLDDIAANTYSSLPLNLRPRQARLPDNPRLRFDRPFLYIVRHNPTGMILYIGRFNPRLLP